MTRAPVNIRKGSQVLRNDTQLGKDRGREREHSESSNESLNPHILAVGQKHKTFVVYTALQGQNSVTTLFFVKIPLRLKSGVVVSVLSCDIINCFNYVPFQRKFEFEICSNYNFQVKTKENRSN